MKLTTIEILKKYRSQPNFIMTEAGDSIRGEYKINATIPKVVIGKKYTVDITFERSLFSPSKTYTEKEVIQMMKWLNGKAMLIRTKLKPII